MSFGFGNDLTDTQRCIVNTFDRNPDMSVTQIASHCDCSESYVRTTLKDNRSNYGSNNPLF